MKLLFLILGSAAALAAQTQPPGITFGMEAPAIGLCGDPVNQGNIYVRSQDPANAPIGVFRCTQVGPTRLGAAAWGWVPIDHYVGANLLAKCAVGDLMFKTGTNSGLYACTAANTWSVVAGISTTGLLNGNYCVNVFNGVATLTQSGCPGGGGGGGLSWAALTSSQWAAMTASQWAALVQ